MADSILRRVVARFEAKRVVADDYEDQQKAVWDEEGRAVDFLNAHASKAKDRAMWWVPPHNMMVNQALTAWNFWTFSILPMFPAKNAYQPKTDRYPEGIVIHPIWHPMEKMGDFGHLDVKTAEKIIAHAKSMPTVQQTVEHEIESVEEHFKIVVPATVKARLVAEAPKVAARRMTVDRLRVKDVLVPLDGSKAIELSRWF